MSGITGSIAVIMGSISAIGTGCAALIAILSISAPVHSQPAAPAGTVEISITNLRSTRGNVLICLTTNTRRFPDCRGDATARSVSVPANAPTTRVTGLAPGTWAIAVIHDENANGRIDTTLGIPREGVGSSRNAPIRMGPPRFADASFVVGTGSVSQSIRMRYLL
jgi:uncharacterized protein (DUF2141 family)